jgi:hypothetical protein
VTKTYRPYSKRTASKPTLIADPSVFFIFFSPPHIFFNSILASRTNGTFGFARHTSRPFAKPKEPYPSQLFVNVAKTANTNPNLNTDLKAIYDAIESSANGYPSEPDIKGLFADFDTTSTRLGNTVESKNNTLAKV